MVRLTRLYSTAPVSAIAERAFAEVGRVKILGDDWYDLDQPEVLIVRAEKLKVADLERATSLRLIARTGVGVDNIDVDAATERGIPVLYAPSAGAQPVAEGAIALMLAAMKRLGELDGVLRAGDWPRRYQVEVRDVSGATLGLVGFGRIGREVARLAQSLGMRVIAHDPIVLEDTGPVRHLPLGELLAQSDVVSLHCPLTEVTRGLIDRETLALVKPGAILVNVARGEIVADEQLLLDALDSGRLSAVALDVFSEEPLATTSVLLRDPRIICTPHAIGLTTSWNERVFGTLAADTASFLRGEPPIHVVDPAALEVAAQRS